MSYAARIRSSRAAAFAGAANPGVGLVRRPPSRAVRRLLFVGDARASLLVPPLQAICAEAGCAFAAYLAPDWQRRATELAVSGGADAVVVAHAAGACVDISSLRASGARPVLQVCGAEMSALELAAAAARVWREATRGS